MATIIGTAGGTEEVAARSSTTTKFTSLTTMCTRDDILPVAAVIDRLHIAHPMEDTRDTNRDRRPIRRPGRPMVAAADTIVLTTPQFPRRGRTTRKPPGRPTRRSPNLLF